MSEAAFIIAIVLVPSKLLNANPGVSKLRFHSFKPAYLTLVVGTVLFSGAWILISKEDLTDPLRMRGGEDDDIDVLSPLSGC